MSLLNFDASRVQPATGELEPVPAAWYDAVMDQSEMKPTKDAATTGNAFLECRFNIASGQYAGRKLYARLNLRNSNPVAAEIAQKELSAICHAVGILQVQDSQQLHGIPLKVKVKVRAGDAQYGASNEISTYKPANFVPDAPVAGSVAPGAFPPPAAAPAQQQPWAAPGQGVAPAGWAPQQPQQPAAAPQQPWQQAPQQPAQAPQQPAPQQPWQQPAAAAPAQAPAWGAPPAAAPAGFPPGAYPPAAAPQQPQQPAQPPATPWAGTPQDPQQQVPPWQRAPGT